MNLADARTALTSGDHGDRLRGARAFIGAVTPEDEPVLRSALRRETDHYVRAALVRALTSSRREVANTPSTPSPGAPSPEAIAEVTTQIIHELSTIAGNLEHHAKREVENYETSKTGRQVRRLFETLGAIRDLRDATRIPDLAEFDFALLLDEIADEVRHEAGVEIVCEGERPLSVTGDKGMTGTIFRNALLNAAEATSGSNTTEPVLVTFGSDDREHWLAVLDRGPGLAASQTELIRPGQTTKTGHTGFGLATASQAARSLGGELTLIDREGGGARLRFSWPAAREQQGT